MRQQLLCKRQSDDYNNIHMIQYNKTNALLINGDITDRMSILDSCF